MKKTFDGTVRPPRILRSHQFHQSHQSHQSHRPHQLISMRLGRPRGDADVISPNDQSELNAVIEPPNNMSERFAQPVEHMIDRSVSALQPPSSPSPSRVFFYYTVQCGAGFGDFVNRFVRLQKVLLGNNCHCQLVVNQHTYVNPHEPNGMLNIRKELGFNYLADPHHRIQFPVRITYSQLLRNLSITEPNYLRTNRDNLLVDLDVCTIEELQQPMHDDYCFRYHSIEFRLQAPKPQMRVPMSSRINVVFHFRRGDLVTGQQCRRQIGNMSDYVAKIDDLYHDQHLAIYMVTDATMNEIISADAEMKNKCYDFVDQINRVIQSKRQNTLEIKGLYRDSLDLVSLLYYSDLCLTMSSSLPIGILRLFNMEHKMHLVRNH